MCYKIENPERAEYINTGEYKAFDGDCLERIIDGGIYLVGKYVYVPSCKTCEINIFADQMFRGDWFSHAPSRIVDRYFVGSGCPFGKPYLKVAEISEEKRQLIRKRVKDIESKTLRGYWVPNSTVFVAIPRITGVEETKECIWCGDNLTKHLIPHFDPMRPTFAWICLKCEPIGGSKRTGVV